VATVDNIKTSSIFVDELGAESKPSLLRKGALRYAVSEQDELLHFGVKERSESNLYRKE